MIPYVIATAGTNGKTTTTRLVTHILMEHHKLLNKFYEFQLHTL